MQQRIYYFDNLKGILIMLVVLGHVIQSTLPDSYQQNIVFRLIYSFHMPLFFTISGYFTCKGYYDKELVKKRAVQLLIPFVLWALLFPIAKGVPDIPGDFAHALLYPDNGLWFLYNLFIYSAMFNISEYLSRKSGKQEFWLLFMVAVLCIEMALFHTMFGVTQLCWFFPFFAIGYYGKKYSFFQSDYNVFNIVIGGDTALQYHFG